MKFLPFLLFCFFNLQLVFSQQVPVYLYFASHNETTDQNFHGLDYNDPVEYAQMRGYIQQVCDTLLRYGMPYEMMLESNFILGCLKNESAATNPNDLIEWVSRQTGFSVQPHNHFKPFGAGANPYNYADLVYLLDSCGVDSAYVMGGFIWRNFTNPVMVNEDWTAWQTPQPGFSFPGARWRPTLLWGGGSPNHIDDFTAYGVWKPKAATSTGFGEHDASKTLVNFGGGCNEDFVLWDTTDATLLAYRILNYADSVQAHFQGNQDAFFNMKVMMNFRHFPSPGYAQKLAQVLRIIQPYRNNGRIHCAGILDTWQAWKNLHPDPADYFALQCESSVEVSNQKPLFLTTVASEPTASVAVAPNPASTVFSLSGNVQSVSVYNVWGERMPLALDRRNQISVAEWPNGVYFLLLDRQVVKLVVQH